VLGSQDQIQRSTSVIEFGYSNEIKPSIEVKVGPSRLKRGNACGLNQDNGRTAVEKRAVIV
jgi:hypothetical protein